MTFSKISLIQNVIFFLYLIYLYWYNILILYGGDLMANQTNNDFYRFIPQNVLTKGKLFNIDYINWIEAVIFTGLIGKAIFMTDLVLKIKIICCCVICLCSFALFLRGIKNRSVLTFFYDMIKYKSSQVRYSLGSVSNERKRKKANIETNFGGTSYFERIVARCKAKFKEFDSKYGKEPN